MRRLVVMLAPALVLLGLPGYVRAAEQIVVTRMFLVKDPPAGPSARKILWKVADENEDGDLSVVGDPTTEGAKLRIMLLPSSHCSVPPCEDGGGDQCFDLPAAGWSPIGTSSFKYVDSTLTNGPVKVAAIKRASSGRFLIKAVLHGAGIALFLEDEIGFYGLNLALGGGDDYRTGSSGAVPNPNDSETFRVKSEDGSTGYVTPCSPSGAFVD